MRGNTGGEETPGGGRGWILNDLVTHSKFLVHLEDSENISNDLKQGHNDIIFACRKIFLVTEWEVDY